MENQPLMRVSCINKGEKIGLVCYSDMVVLDSQRNIVAIRIGGYPESVQGISDLIIGGCSLELQGTSEIIKANTKYGKSYERRLSHDGIYAEGIYWLKDDALSGDNGGDEENQEQNKDRNLYFYCKNEDELYDELDRKLSVPLIPEFKEYFIKELTARKLIKPLRVISQSNGFFAWHMNVSYSENEIADVLKNGLDTGEITIPGAANTGLYNWDSVNSFTQYLHTFGTMLAEKIKQCLPPYFHPAKESISKEVSEVNDYIRQNTGYSLFDAQLCAAEAIKRQLQKDRMALLVAECGSGKTKIAASAVYAYHKASHKDKSFNIVICPSHITGKWVREIEETVPDSYAMHVTTMAEADALHEYYLEHEKAVYCILSKETARNGYMKKPNVLWNPIKKAFVCPHCDTVQEMDVLIDGSKFTEKADASFYLNENGKNHKCQNKECNEVLWSAVNPLDLEPKHNIWVRIGGYGFVHRKFLKSAYSECKSKDASEKIYDVMNNPDGIFPPPGAYRRCSLSGYIKKKLKRIDVLIVDELHQYSGESAQGQAMAELAGIADKVLGMTATLINGYAKGMFYLLFRLKSNLMLADGQNYNKPRDFCQQYGVVEEVYEIENPKFYNSASKAIKRKVREKFMPGVSPIVYSRFLLENTVFLSLVDMGKDLPDYEEIPVSCQMSEEVEQEYKRLENDFKRIIREDRALGNKILSTYMNLLTAYPDQPYGHSPIMNPLVSNTVLTVPHSIGNITALQPKDIKAIEIVERKIKAGENVLIFTSWTRLDTQEKLSNILNSKGIPTVILKPSVSTVKREEWVSKKLNEGMRVMIANPTLVETGLDLNAFTTLIFYDMAYNLYVFRQASRRSWRINQTAPKVEVYMLYYANTIQQRALRLMASKLSVATVIEGNLSEEGLASMSESKDMITQLAKEIVDGVKENTDSISFAFSQMLIKHERKQEVHPDSKYEAPGNINIRVLKPSLKPDYTGQISVFDLLAS